MSTAQLAEAFGKGSDAWPPEAWAVLEEEVARRERAARVLRLRGDGGLVAGGEGPPKRRARILFRVLLAVAGLLAVGYWALSRLPFSEIPTCDSEDAQSIVRGAIENAVDARVMNHRLLALHNQTEVSYNEPKLERKCRATAILNTGEERISYRLYKLSAADRTFFVQVTYR